MSTRLTGLSALNYTGVQPSSPPNYVQFNFDPTIESLNFFLGDMWLNKLTKDVWMLVRQRTINGTPTGTWVKFSSGGNPNVVSLTGNTGGAVFGDAASNINVVGDTTTINIAGNPATHTLTVSATGIMANNFPTDFNGPAIPAAGVLNIFGAATIDAEAVALVYRQNIHTNGTGNTVQVKLNDSISLPNSTTNGQQGVIYLGGTALVNRFISNFGSGNTFVGHASGNTTLTGTNSAGFGTSSLSALTTGVGNSGLGNQSGMAITTGTANTAIGDAALYQLTTGSYNATLGYLSGAGYTTTENSNIAINAVGSTGQSNVLNIGSGTGTGNQQLNTAIISGIYGRPVGTTNSFVFVDNTNTLGTVGNFYSTGTFVPTLMFGGASVGIVYNYNLGKYTQIGNIVFIDLSISASSKGVSVGQAVVSGLPFPVVSAGANVSMDAFLNVDTGITLSAGYAQFWVNFFPIGSSLCNLEQGANDGVTPTIHLTNTNFTNTIHFTVQGYYYMA